MLHSRSTRYFSLTWLTPNMSSKEIQPILGAVRKVWNKLYTLNVLLAQNELDSENELSELKYSTEHLLV